MNCFDPESISKLLGGSKVFYENKSVFNKTIPNTVFC